MKNGVCPLVLALPGLLANVQLPPAPSLARLVAYAPRTRRDEDGIAAMLAPLYGIAKQDDWPLAAIRVAALGVDTGTAYWLAATPVTLTAGLDDVRLDGAVRDLSAADSDAMIATLNAHFAADGIAFVAPKPDAWFLRAPSPAAIATHPLDAALGRTLRALLPEGDDARTWRRWLNEIQMLLFEHPVNVARERDGKPPANSVWFDGGGTMPARAAGAQAIRTWTRDETIAALAAFAGARAQAVPPALDATNGDATRVVAFDAGCDVAHVDRAFAQPALHALERGAIDAVAIVADGAGAAIEWRAERPSAWTRIGGRFAKHELASTIAAHASEDR